MNSSTAGFVSYYETFEAAEAGKRRERDHETDHHHRDGLSVALDLRDRTARESGSVQITIRPESHRNRHRPDTITVGKKENTIRIGCSAS
ncbi:MAG: hypothetical protein M3O72_07300, partial [Verrucomicrobiota bacterium]|nr:hypothetical protein [Verrucomicrobiota bacterium]